MGKESMEKLSRSEQIVQLFFNYLDQHILDVINGCQREFFEINQIAKNLAISHQHLTDTVQKETGNHPCYFYDLKIIDKAKEIILNTDYSLAEIANIFTYDPSNFSKFFKKFTGVPPGKYRKMHR
ncbi:helix-turn-helix domain-containing protein [Myroides sp. C15-4]|uniref:helix-turn-helix domain-containing protein n=1 Tax=unclassified Myroides TaxID=2642485 RepID=UPI0015F7A026|nr:AraC family transcriptional regulator [Myroides sp. WP-1]MBB1137942.1 helix-turn-helix transcriptional regulator [Myroides sp. WP-1]